VTSGVAAGARLILLSVVDDIAVFGPAPSATLLQIQPGDSVVVDNSGFLAAQTYHRHQVPDSADYPVWDQFRHFDGSPMYPQRPLVLGPLFAAAAAGTVQLQTGWEVYPEALEHTVRLAAEHAGVPVLVTENGMATDDDRARIAYTQSALEGLARCLAAGIDVRGYLHWTFLDNFEWMSGYAMTFGLVAVDRESLARTVKPSARWLGEVGRANALR
jgi:hypothetical protein